jgi:hypothetical protein
MGRLLAYPLAAGKGSAIQKSLITRALEYRPLDRRVRGMVRVLRELGWDHNRIIVALLVEIAYW